MMTFREFVGHFTDEYKYSDLEVANIYFHNPAVTVRELASKSDRSIGEMYRLLRQYGEPNRRQQNHHNVIALADSGLPKKTIADMTGYSERHVRNILNDRSENGN